MICVCVCIFVVGLVLIACQKSNLLYNKGAKATVSFTYFNFESHRIASACTLSELNNVLKL